jgi:hypothetical protein
MGLALGCQDLRVAHGLECRSGTDGGHLHAPDAA